MKKILFIAAVCFTGITFNSCEKAADQIIPGSQPENAVQAPAPLTTFNGISVVNGMLRFETLADYYAVVDHPNPQTRSNFADYAAGLPFDNHFSKKTSEQGTPAKQEMDDFFGKIINANNCIQIGKHIYNVDLAKETVFVMEADQYASHAGDLIAGNKSNTSVTSFGLTDDVLGMVNGLYVERCNNPSGGFEISSVTESGTSLESRCYLKYFTAGIYYRVTGRTKKIGNHTLNYRFYLECINATTEIRRNPCSNSEVTIHNIGVKLNTYNNPEAVWEMYSKAWKIKNYTHIQIRSRVEYYDPAVTLFRSTPPISYTLN